MCVCVGGGGGERYICAEHETVLLVTASVCDLSEQHTAKGELLWDKVQRQTGLFDPSFSTSASIG